MHIMLTDTTFDYTYALNVEINRIIFLTVFILQFIINNNLLSTYIKMYKTYKIN